MIMNETMPSNTTSSSLLSSTIKSSTITTDETNTNINTTTITTSDSQELANKMGEKVEESATEDSMQDELDSDNQSSSSPVDSYEAQENVHNAVLAEPEPSNGNCSSNASSKEMHCNESPPPDSSDEPSESNLLPADGDNESSLERRAYRPGSNSLSDEIKRFRSQRNKLLLRPRNLKRKRKRKKASAGSKKNTRSAAQLTRQGTTTAGYGNMAQDWPVVGSSSNQVSSTIKQHFPTLASPLNLSSTVQKLIMGKFSTTQQQNPSQQQPQNTRQFGNQPAGGANVFYQQASGFADNQRNQPTQSDLLLNQWASSASEASSAFASSASARAKQQAAAAAGKLIPIEIIGLDPMITKSILETNQGALDGAQPPEVGKMYPKSQHVAAESVFGSDSTRPAPGSLGNLRGQPGVPASIVHIHHFHTKAAAAAAAAAQQQQQQQQVVPTDESAVAQQQQHDANNGSSFSATNRLRESGGDNSPDVHIVNPAQQKLIQTDAAKQPQQMAQITGQQVYMNDRGELVYLAAPGDQSESLPQQANGGGGGGEQEQEIKQPPMDSQRVEQQASDLLDQQRQLGNNGGGDISPQHDKIAGESVNPVHQVAGGAQPAQIKAAMEFAPPIRHEIHNHSTTYFMQQQQQHPFKTQQVSSSSLAAQPHTMLLNGEQQQQRVFLTTNGKTVSLVSGQQPQGGVEMGDKKYLMVAYKPQQQSAARHLSQFRNVSSIEDLLVGGGGGRNQYEGQESKASMISAGAAHQLLRGASLAQSAAGSQQQSANQVPTMFDQFDSDLAIIRPHTNGSTRPSWSKSLLVGETLQERAKINSQLAARGQQQQLADNRVPSMSTIASLVNSNLGESTTTKATPVEGNLTASNSSKVESGEPGTRFRATWMEPASDPIKPTNGYSNNSSNTTLSALSGQNQDVSTLSDTQGQQLPAQVINILRLMSNNTANKLSSDELLRRLIAEIRLRNSSAASNGEGILGLNFQEQPPNKQQMFNSTQGGSNFNGNFHSSSQLQSLMQKNPHVGVDGTIRNHHQHNRLHGKHHIEPQRQPGLAVVEEPDFGDSTNGLSNIALAFIFVVSLLTLTLIAASMIYRYRRRSVGRCADLPPNKSRLNFTQRTKRFVRSNFSNHSNHHEAASIKSINLDLGTNTLNRKGLGARKETGINSGVAGNTSNAIGNKTLRPQLTDRYTMKPAQPFGHKLPLSSFNAAAGTLTSSHTFTNDSTTAADIKMLNTKLQKSNYLKSLISSSECLASQPVSQRTSNSNTTNPNRKHSSQSYQQHQQHQQKMHQQLLHERAAKSRQVLDSSCYLSIRHGGMDSLNSAKQHRIPLKCKSPQIEDYARRSHSFKRGSIMDGDVGSYHQNYSFAYKSPSSERRYNNDRNSIDSHMDQPNRMSTIHSMSESDPKSIASNSCHNEQQQPFKRHSNISYRVAGGKLNSHLMTNPKHLPETGAMDDACTRPTELAQIDRL